MASVRQLTTPNKEGKRPWVVAYTDPSGKRKQATPKSGLKKDADALRRKIEREIEDGLHVAASETITVREACEQYIRHTETRMRSGGVGRTWYGMVKGVCDGYIIPRFGALDIAELTFREVENWHRSMMPRLSPVTAKGHLTLFSQIETFARKRGYTKKTIVSDVSADIGGAKRRVIRTFSLDHARKLVELVEAREPNAKVRGHHFLKASVQLAAFCGLRMGEIMGLTQASLDFETGVLKIRHSLTQHDELKGPKTAAGKRDVPMPDRVRDTLREWCLSHYLENDRNLIFRMSDGDLITRSNFHNNYWRPLLRRAGLFDKADVFHFHALRHFAASLMIDLGLPLTDVASLMGHEKFDMTLQVYAHPIVGGNRRREAFERMSSALTAERNEEATSAPKLLELQVADPVMSLFDAVVPMSLNPEPVNARSVYEGRGLILV